MFARGLLFLIAFSAFNCVFTDAKTLNNRPIVGVLTQEVSRFVRRIYKTEDYQSYIAASYVKFVEGSGGRVIPIWINQTRDYYEDILSKINGVLLPGGATFFNETYGYAEAGEHIYDIAKKMNDAGDYMPIWGTCLGFELLIYLSSNRNDYRTSCSSSAQPLPLEFQAGYEKSRLFGSASSDIIDYFSNYSLTANFHIFCYTPDTFKKYALYDEWNVLSLSYDWNGQVFISSIEHKKYPFYGVQFHPEKNIYEFVPNRNISHTSKAVQVAQYLGNFILEETRKNAHYFSNKTEESMSLIYNYNPRYTGAVGSAFVQQYLFTAFHPKSNENIEINNNNGSNAPACISLAIIFVCLLSASFI